MATPTGSAKPQSPLKIDPATDELISQGAHFLGMIKMDFVVEATRVYLEQQREKIRAGMIESMKVLDGSTCSAGVARPGPRLPRPRTLIRSAQDQAVSAGA